MPRAPKINTLDVMCKWYWLMLDVAKGEAYRSVAFNMDEWGVRVRDDHVTDILNGETDGFDESFVAAVQKVKEPWCGTAACAAGFLAFSGIIPGVKPSVNESGMIRMSKVGYPGDIDILLPELGSAWYDIVYHFNTDSGKQTTARNIATRIREVTKRVFKVDPAKIERPPNLPWEGKQTAFGKKKPAKRPTA